MAIIEFRSSEQAYDADGIFPTCCGLQPQALRWRKEKSYMAVMCVNPECENHAGVLDHVVDIRKKWDRFRAKSENHKEELC